MSASTQRKRTKDERRTIVAELGRQYAGTLTTFVREQYQQHGRGALVVIPTGDGGRAYCPRDHIQHLHAARVRQDVLAAVDSYNPSTELVLLLVVPATDEFVKQMVCTVVAPNPQQEQQH